MSLRESRPVQKLPVYAGIAVMAIGALTILGWIFQSDLLRELGRGLPAMKINTALAFLFGGAALLLHRRYRTAPILCAAVTILLGALTLTEYGFGVDLRIDDLFAFDPAPGMLPAGRMALATAAIFMMGGLAIVLSYASRLFRVSHALAIGASFLSLLCFATVCYGGMSDGGLVALGSPALGATLASCLFSIGILALDEDHGLIAALQRPGVNGTLARRLLPAAVIAPFLLGFVRLYGQQQGLYGTEFGLAILTTSTVTILVVLIWFNADSLFHMEAREAETARLLAQQNQDLARQASLIDHSHDAIFTMDSGRHIRSWNRGAQELYGYTAAEAAGQITHQFLRTTSSVNMTEVDAILAETGRWDGELVHIRRDGKTVTVESRQVLLRNEKGEVTGILEINRDITASRAIEEQLRQTQKLESIGQLAAGVAHDFNNLLTVITGYANMLLVEPSLDETLHCEVEEIVAAADRAAEITRQLLAFSRRQVTVRQNIVLNDVVARMEKMVRRLIGENIEFSLGLDEERQIIYADAGQIEQVVMNLAVNARDAISGIGRIAVETGHMLVDAEYSASHLGVKPGSYAVLSVSDTGMGMTPEVKARIFEPFFTTKEKGKGTGLGLSTVYGIVDQNSGAVVVYSEPGKGTTFKILLPVSDGPVSGPRADSVLQSLEGTETILLVEDEDALRDFVRLVLERHGYSVLSAANGREGLEMARQHHAAIHLLLSDVVMPEMGGLDLADQVSGLYPKIAVLHMSGYTERFWERGGTARFLQKPFTAAGLLTKIRGTLESAG